MLSLESYPHRGTRVGGGGVDGSPPWVFDMLQYFETILPSVESLWSSLQDKATILDFIKNYKSGKNGENK